MRHVKAIDLVSSLGKLREGNDNRKKCFKLLLNATQKNKYISSFGQSLPTAFRNEPLVSEIEYHLKLNRCGRHMLDTPSKELQRLWPAILVRMASKPEDAGALFFFIRQYFMRNSYPLRRQQQQQQQQQHGRQVPPPHKRARVVHDGESGGEKGELLL